MKLGTPEERSAALVIGAAIALGCDIAARGLPLPGDTGPCSIEGRIDRAFEIAAKFLVEAERRSPHK